MAVSSAPVGALRRSRATNPRPSFT
jgi:hypothetical protein